MENLVDTVEEKDKYILFTLGFIPSTSNILSVAQKSTVNQYSSHTISGKNQWLVSRPNTPSPAHTVILKFCTVSCTDLYVTAKYLNS